MDQHISPYTVNPVPCLANCDIVGLSGRFPDASSGSEFFSKLAAGVDMVSDDERKWKHFMHPDVPKRCGKFKPGELASFDAQFFGVHGQQAKRMDPQLYKLLEVSWEAWADSGIDVRALRDSNRVGVYTGICGSEIHGLYIHKDSDIIGYEQTGCVMCMTANRLSYFYSFRGPSKTCDTACSSAAHSLHDALADITAGRTDYAIVLGSCHILAANMTLAFNRLHMLSPEGACKAFDAAGNGYVRSEGILAIVLKRSDLETTPMWAAVSPYATILNCGLNNDGYTKEGITFPSRHAQLVLEQQVCQAADINPADITYVEAHGTGTVAGDGQELYAINTQYGQAAGRSGPVLIGSVKSNMGHCEGASCLAGVIKVALALEYGLLPGNLHYHRDTPNPESEGLRDGTLEVVDTTRPMEGGLIALSSFGFGGANMHLVMDGHRAGQRLQVVTVDSGDTKRDNTIPLAARTADGLAYLARIIIEAEAADDVSFANPLRRYANTVASDMRLSHRGTLTDGKLKSGAPATKAPEVWYAFSGNGSQWAKMGLTLLQNNAVFAAAVHECAAVLKPFGVDLIAVFGSDKGYHTPTLMSVGLLAIQIALVDVLREEYGIEPAGMLGHSAGEIACGYASGCFTREQAMLIAYHRGRLPTERGISSGLMAATGLSAEQCKQRVAGTNVVMACDNSPTSTTVSGPATDVKAFIAQLEGEGVFARALETNGVPYHSPVLEPLLAELSESLEKVLPSPKPKPVSWVSAVYPETSDDPNAQVASAGYQVHAYRNPVLFREAAEAIPANALVVEIGPHAVLRTLLRGTRPELAYASTMTKGADGQETLAAAVGDMWRAGVPVRWSADPVPRITEGTEVPRAIREALVSWDRTLYDIPVIEPEKPAPGVLYERIYDLGGEDSYICDHTIDGNVFIPLACFLVTAWEAFAKWEEKTIWEMPVEFTDVSVYQPVQVERTSKVALNVIFDFNQRFQVLHGNDVIADGVLKKYDAETQLAKEHRPMRTNQNYAKPPKEQTGVDFSQVDHLLGEHWYSLCERQNLQYGPKFQMVTKYGVDRAWCDLKWDKNWIIHLDGVFQTADRVGDHHVHVARGMRRLVINDTMADVEEGYEEHLDFDTFWKVTRGRSVILEDYKDEIATSKHKAAKTLVHRMQFFPYGVRESQDAARAAYGKKVVRLLKGLLDASKAASLPLLKIKGLIDQLKVKALSSGDQEKLTAAEDNGLAQILADVLGGEDAPTQLDITEHSKMTAALEDDPFLTGLRQREAEFLFGLAIGNQKQSGYSVLEVGCGAGAFTKQALKAFITVPQSSLLSYTATDVGPTSDVTRNVGHKSISYKQWDFNSGTAEAPEAAHIVVANNLSATAKDLPSTVAALYNQTLEGGFLILQELTGPLGAAIFSWSKDAWKLKDGRKFGTCTSVEHWRSLLADAGFTEVSTVTSYDSAFFVWRKCPETPAKAVLLEGITYDAPTEQISAWIKSYIAALDSADAEDDDSKPGKD